LGEVAPTITYDLRAGQPDTPVFPSFVEIPYKLVANSLASSQVDSGGMNSIDNTAPARENLREVMPVAIDLAGSLPVERTVRSAEVPIPDQLTV
jgi:hypothetical protein